MFGKCCLSAALVLTLLVSPWAAGQEKDKADTATAEKAKAEKATVAVFHIRGTVSEKPGSEELSFSTEPTPALKDLTARLRKAAEDKSVTAVLITADEVALGPAQVEELRQGMAALRAADKEVYVHSDSMDTLRYVLLCGASRLSMAPVADLWLTGIYTEQPYLNGLLTKLGVKADYLTCGAYKGAAEIFTRSSPSKEADEMHNWLLDSLFQTHLEMIADGRGVSKEQAKKWIDGGPYSAERAKEAGLIDAVEHRQDVLALLKKKYGEDTRFDARYGRKKSDLPDFSSPFGVLQFWSELISGPKKKVHKTSVAIVYVDGPIMLGSGTTSLFGGAEGAFSSDLRRALDKAASDETIKAVVLRINSPGGSATASEIILDATRRVKEKKPLVVSMGNLAASGGYYVTCAADTIFADRSTMTGSIGVVAGKLATTAMWNKVGITWKSYQRGANSGLLSSADIFTPSERERVQSWMDEIYAEFKGHVQESRGSKLKKDLDDLAGGRVYTGQQALELGLVDKIGTLQDAIEFAAAQAKLEDYEVRVVPEPKSFIELLLEDSSGKTDEPLSLDAGRSPFGSPMAAPRRFELLEMALPLIQGLDPQRVQAVQRSLLQLETLRSEGVALIMPELIWRGR